ncbi:MAG TPA: ATP-binding protein, partial [Acidobacteriota bacterium]|nr:ATP-binding protein [Acidobacteriota bacterium]
TRMAVITAILFSVFGCVLILLGIGGRRTVNASHIVLLPPAILTYLVLIGYLLRVPVFYQWMDVGIALNTGLAFSALCLASFCARPDTWLMQVFTGDEAGGIMARRLLLPLFFLPLLIAWLRLSGERLGFFHSEVGVAMVAVTYTVCFLGLVWLSAHSVNRTDRRRRQAEETLRESEERFRLLFEQAAVGINRLDQEGRLLEVNDTLCSILGYSREELLNLSLDDLTYPEDRPREQSELAALFSRQIPSYSLEKRCRRKDGSVIWTRVTSSLPSGDNRPSGWWISVVEDITKRKAAEEQVFHQQTILEGINRIFHEALTCPTEEHLGRTCLTVMEQLTGSRLGFIAEVNDQGTLDDIAISDSGWEACLMSEAAGQRNLAKNRKIHGVYGRVINDGKGFYTNDLSAHPDRIGLPDGHAPITAFLGVPLKRGQRTVGMVAVGNRPGGYGDENLKTMEALAPAIMEALTQKRAETAERRGARELARSNKDLEQFAYVASHDLQEPLRAVAGFVTLLERRFRGKLDADAHRFIDYAVDGVRRMQMLINDLLAYSRVGMAGKAHVNADLKKVLDTALSNLDAVIRESSAVVTAEPLPTVQGDASQLTQLFQNLINNAIKFRSEHKPEIHVGAVRTEHGWEFSVRDNGIGIDSNYAERIFLIFQRLHTRDRYPGTGIGLAICKRIVERHGGQIWVESQQGRGSTFHFSISDKGEQQW